MRVRSTRELGARHPRPAAYGAYLTSRRWSDKRRQWYAAWLTVSGIEPSCLVCGRRWTLKSGHLHHLTYARLGDESLQDLLPLCRRDHRRLHAIIDAHPGWRRVDRRTATAAIIAEMRQALAACPSETQSPSAAGTA